MEPTTLNEIGAALSKAQAHMKGAAKDSQNPFFKSKYADLSSVWDACREALTTNGLSVVQMPGYDDATKCVTLTTILLHCSGQSIASMAAAPIAKPDAQTVGSAITYLRRYALAAFVGVCPEDDDGEAAKAKPTQKPQESRPKPPEPPKSEKVSLDTLLKSGEFKGKPVRLAGRDYFEGLVSKFTGNKTAEKAAWFTFAKDALAAFDADDLRRDEQRMDELPDALKNPDAGEQAIDAMFQQAKHENLKTLKNDMRRAASND